MADDKELKVVFAPGCFDNFDGTQEELDEMLAEIMGMVKAGTLFENSQPVDFDELDEETIAALSNSISNIPRTVQ